MSLLQYLGIISFLPILYEGGNKKISMVLGRSLDCYFTTYVYLFIYNINIPLIVNQMHEPFSNHSGCGAAIFSGILPGGTSGAG